MTRPDHDTGIRPAAEDAFGSDGCCAHGRLLHDSDGSCAVLGCPCEGTVAANEEIDRAVEEDQRRRHGHE